MDKIGDISPEIHQRIIGMKQVLSSGEISPAAEAGLRIGKRLREYDALKNMIALVVTAAEFVMRLPQNLALKPAAAAHLLPHNRLQNMPGYPFSMPFVAVARVLAACRKLPPKTLNLRKRDYFRLFLPLPPFKKKRGMARIVILLAPSVPPCYTILKSIFSLFSSPRLCEKQLYRSRAAAIFFKGGFP